MHASLLLIRVLTLTCISIPPHLLGMSKNTSTEVVIREMVLEVALQNGMDKSWS